MTDDNDAMFEMMSGVNRRRSRKKQKKEVARCPNDSADGKEATSSVAVREQRFLDRLASLERLLTVDYPAKFSVLEQFYEKMTLPENRGAFDEEDFDQLLRKFSVVRAEFEKLKEQYLRLSAIYDKEYKLLKSKIENREKFFDEMLALENGGGEEKQQQQNIFTDFPDLANFYVAKQMKLEKSFDELIRLDDNDE